MKTVSIITPVFNTAEYIEECIQSVLEQTYDHIELIVVDDCSTDQSYEILKKFANEQKSIKVFQTKQNQGTGAARNLGLEKATGDFIYFLDSDDVLPKQTIELLVNHIGEHDMIRGRMNTNHLINSFVLVYHNAFNPRMYTDNKYNLLRNDSAINFLIRRSYIEQHALRFNENVKVYSDLYFMIPALQNANMIPYMSEAIYLKRRRANPMVNPSLTQQAIEVTFLEYTSVYVDLKERFKGNPLISSYLDKQLLNRYRKNVAVKIEEENLYEPLFFALRQAMLMVNREDLKTYDKVFQREIKAIQSGRLGKYKRINKQHHFLRDAYKGRKSKSALKQFAYKHIFLRLRQQKKWVFFESFGGKGYSDSPKYIYEYMMQHKEGYEFIWSVNDLQNIPGPAKQVRRSSLKYYYYLARAKYWVSNARMPNKLYKPKNKVYLQTWHGTPLKKLAGDMDNVLMPGTNPATYKRNFSNETAKWDYLIAPNAYSSEIFRRAFWFNNTMLEVGYPRNDVLYNLDDEENIRALKAKMKLPQDKKVVLYAPTWRDDEYYEVGSYRFDLKLELDRMQRELGDEYVVVLRMHYLIATNMDISAYEGFAYDFSSYGDISELYLVSDVLITDYSSVFFDYANLRRPILFYTYDIDKYRDQLRGFYLDMETEVPGPLLTTTEEVIDSLTNLPALNEAYKDRYETFYNRFCAWDDGTVSERVVKSVFKD